MSARSDDVEELTAAITSLDGVRGLFPDHPIGAVVLTLVTADRDRATATADVTREHGRLEIRARLALDRSTPIARSLLQVYDEIDRRFPGEDARVSLEVAYLD